MSDVAAAQVTDQLSVPDRQDAAERAFAEIVRHLLGAGSTAPRPRSRDTN